MQVAAAGAGSLSQPETFVKTLPELARVPTPGRAEDGVSHSLQDLASPHITDLLGRLEHARNGHSPEMFAGLLRTAVAAVGTHDIHGALSAIAQMVKLHPEHAAQLGARGSGVGSHPRGSEPSVRAVDGGGANGSRPDACGCRDGGSCDAIWQSVSVIATAERFLESGTLLNYVRATELGQSVLALYPITAKVRSDMPLRWLRAIWRRVPLLVLLTGWFLIGLIGGIIPLVGRPVGSGSVEIWAFGFLVLVGFQFVVTVRNIRLR